MFCIFSVVIHLPLLLQAPITEGHGRLHRSIMVVTASHLDCRNRVFAKKDLVCDDVSHVNSANIPDKLRAEICAPVTKLLIRKKYASFGTFCVTCSLSRFYAFLRLIPSGYRWQGIFIEFKLMPRKMLINASHDLDCWYLVGYITVWQLHV